jgi:HEAT repeat protein
MLLAGPPGGRSFSAEQAQRRLLDRLSRAAAPAERETSPTTDADTPTQSRTDEELLSMLEEPTWVLLPPLAAAPLEWRPAWHHPAVTELARRVAAGETSLDQMHQRMLERLRRPGPDGRLAAALLLSEWGDPAGMAELNRHLLDTQAPPAARSNAACALARFGPLLDPASLEQLVLGWIPDRTIARRVVSEKDEPLVSALIYAWVSAQKGDPSFDPSRDELMGFLAKCPHPPFRRLVAMGYAGKPWDSISSPLDRLLEDSEPQVRRSALAALVAHPTRVGRDVVLKLSRDVDVSVAVEGVRGMAHYPDVEIATRLAEQAKSPSAMIREAAVESAGALGQESIVLEAAGDPQASVRVAAARALARFPAPVALPALTRLLADDRASAVQAAVLGSLVSRPAAEGVPLLLQGLDSASARTREEAQRQLTALSNRPEFRNTYSAPSAGRWSRSLAMFHATDPAEARGAQLADLRLAWGSMELVRQVPSTPPDPVAGEDVTQARQWVRQSAEGNLSPELWSRWAQVPVVTIEEAVLVEDWLPSEEFVERVLAPRDPAYPMLLRVNAATPSQVTTLVAQFERRPMSRLQGVLLASALREETRADIWTRLMPRGIEALARSEMGSVERAAVDRLVCLGMRHDSDLVREAVCDRLAEHPGLVPSEGLAAVMSDPSERVRRSAIRAAGATADQKTIGSLRDALRSSSAAIQAEAAAQLLAQGEKEGFETLRRLAYSPDDDVRRRVLTALVNHPRVERDGTLQLLTQFLSDGKLEIRQRAVAGLEKVVGPLEGETVPARVFTEEQVARWKRTMASYFSPADSAEKLQRMEMIRKTQESLQVLPIAN